MKLVRVPTAAGPRYARLDGEHAEILAGEFGSFVPTGERVVVERLLAPIQPSKVVCVATNYAAHAAEMGKPIPDEPRLFLKPPSSVIGPGDPILLPPGTTRVDHESELGVVIGQRIAWDTPDVGLDAVYGYTIVNDVTARDYQKKDVIFGRAKGFDTFCPIGPWVDTAYDPTEKWVTAHVDGVEKQRGPTSDLVFGIEALLRFIRQIMTLLPGDVIATGTPPGVSPLAHGMRVVCAIEGLGSLENPVLDRADR